MTLTTAMYGIIRAICLETFPLNFFAGPEPSFRLQLLILPDLTTIYVYFTFWDGSIVPGADSVIPLRICFGATYRRLGTAIRWVHLR